MNAIQRVVLKLIGLDAEWKRIHASLSEKDRAYLALQIDYGKFIDDTTEVFNAMSERRIQQDSLLVQCGIIPASKDN